MAEQKFTRENIQKKLEEKREANKKSYVDLMRQGAELEPFAMVMVRLDTLIDLLLSEEQKEMMDLAFENNLGDVIAEAKNEVAKTKLTSKLIVPGQ